MGHLQQRFPLPLVDLTQIENLALDDIPPSATLVLYQAPIDMMFAVFESIVRAQEQTTDFSELFARAAAACAESQRIVGLSTQTMRFARSSRADAMRLRRAAVLMRDTWTEAEAVHSVLRSEVERVARGMRDAGVNDRAAVATVRAHIRVLLYDGGLAEQDAEPVVARASLWVEQIYAAA